VGGVTGTLPTGADPSQVTASQTADAASLFGKHELAPDEKRIYAILRADEPTHIDELVERLVSHLSPTQIFAASFELD